MYGIFSQCVQRAPSSFVFTTPYRVPIRLDHLAVSDIHADMPLVPDGKTGCFRDGVNGTGNRRSMIHFVCRDIRHTVRVVDDFFCLRVQPAVAFDQTDAVRRSAADPRLADEICVAGKSVWVLRQLRFEQAFCQHMTERAPDVAPVFFVGVNGVLHQIVGVLASRVREAGCVQLCAAVAVP